MGTQKSSLHTSRKLLENPLSNLYSQISSPAVRGQQLALRHPSAAAGINLFLYVVLKTTLEVSRIFLSSQKKLQREGFVLSTLGPRAGHQQHPKAEGDPAQHHRDTWDTGDRLQASALW